MYLGTRHQYGIISYPFYRWIEGPGTSAGRLNHAYSPQVCIYVSITALESDDGEEERDTNLRKHRPQFDISRSKACLELYFPIV
ncbi:hypothetical protein TWF751_002766 [Orbilia oligospora]|nr:hypothetical protein TWF751_002766 [Orbilia oligospora]